MKGELMPAPDFRRGWRGTLLLLLFLSVVTPGGVHAATGDGPLLMPGKKTLYQRFLTRPGTVLLPLPGAGDAAPVPVPAFSVYYVYGSLEENGVTYMKVGSDPLAPPAGRIAQASLVPWKQTLALAFAPPVNRGLALFFDTRDNLRTLLREDDPEESLRAIRRAVRTQDSSRMRGVIAVEPDNYVDISRQFYLLPILDHERFYLPSGFGLRMVKVASVNLRRPPASPPAGGVEDQTREGEVARILDRYSTALVFVVDATSSMGPYIEQTRQALTRVYNKIGEAGLEDRVRFGVVAYRGDPSARRGIGYLSRLFVDPGRVSRKEEFLSAVQDLSAARVSTEAFAEDGLAGLQTAMEEIDWNRFGGRYIVLVTDASLREHARGDSPSLTGLDVSTMHSRARAANIAILTLHLKTPAGRNDHRKAEGQYRELSRYGDLPASYFPVPLGDVNAFREKVDQLADVIVEQVRNSAQMHQEDIAAADGAGDRTPPGAGIATQARDLGRAMRLAYLGRELGTEAPEMYEAWTTDRDPAQPTGRFFDVRLLINRAQLSDLQQALREVIRAGLAGQLAPDDFFDQLQSATVAMSRDPSRIGRGAARNLAELGLLGEYLDGLPYRSALMVLDQAQWTGWSTGERQAFIDSIEAKIRLYGKIYEELSNWVALEPSAPPPEWVYALPLDDLP